MKQTAVYRYRNNEYWMSLLDFDWPLAGNFKIDKLNINKSLQYLIRHCILLFYKQERNY